MLASVLHWFQRCMAYPDRQMAVKWQMRIVMHPIVVVVVELGSEIDQRD
jgi:hypothetical protein